MVDGQRRERWELAAEELIRRVRILTDDHYDDLVAVFQKNGRSPQQAEFQLLQLVYYTDALRLELSLNSHPRRSIGRHICSAIKVTVSALVIAGINLATADAYAALVNAEVQAEQVDDCLEQPSSGDESDGLDHEFDGPVSSIHNEAPISPPYSVLNVSSIGKDALTAIVDEMILSSIPFALVRSDLTLPDAHLQSVERIMGEHLGGQVDDIETLLVERVGRAGSQAG